MKVTKDGPGRTGRRARSAASLLLAGMVASTALVGLPNAPAGAEPGDELPETGQVFEHYPAMQDVYEDYFSFGMFGRGEIESAAYNYASYTPGNEMKPESVQAEKGVFTFGPADAMMEQYEEANPDMLFYGHTLAWHSQTPAWMWDAPPARYGQPGTFDADVALENLNTHIETVLNYYGEDLEAIDVVNEAVGTANPDDWRASLAKGEGWYPALGSDWVELAFLKAAEVVDDNGWDVKLIYNDFGLNDPKKARVVYEMVKEINERNAGTRPDGKQLIEVIGMQGHYGLATDISDVDENIALFATLEGVEINITELDVGVPPGELTEEKENNQGLRYAELFQTFRKYAAGPANTSGNPRVITAVKIAGVRDVESGWRGGEYAMPYDYDGLAKKALLGILWPEEFLASHVWIEPENGANPNPEIDGVYVYHAQWGDAYTGANIILGDDATEWPWSSAGDDGRVAFEPEPGSKYRLSVNTTAEGTTAVRVRWVKDSSNGGYTEADGVAVNDHEYNSNEVAKHVPAYFTGLINMGTTTLVTEFTMDGKQPADGLVGNIAIRGGGGGSAYTINSVMVERIGAAGEDDEILVNWPEGIDTETPTEPTEPPVEPTEPPVEPTEPPVEPTEPPVEPTEPPVEPTEPNDTVEPSEAPQGEQHGGDPSAGPEGGDGALPKTGADVTALLGAGLVFTLLGLALLFLRPTRGRK